MSPRRACVGKTSIEPNLLDVSDTATGLPPAIFTAAAESVRSAVLRSDLQISEIPAPSALAPWALALAADVTPARHDSDSDHGTGRFVLLHDPVASESWGGEFRIICFAQAPLETEMGVDPFLADVAWSWLVDALGSHGATYTSASGTATRILSTGFGELQAQGDGAQIELRASWTPAGHDMSAHVQGWAELVCMLAGLPPAIEGVSVLPNRRVARD